MKDIFVKTTLQYLAVEYHNYESHNYRKRQVFSLKCQWVILRHCLLFSHCYTEYIKLLQSPNEMYLYSQLSIAARVHIHTRQKKKKKPLEHPKWSVILCLLKVSKPALLRIISSYKRTSASAEKTLKMKYPQPNIVKY